MSNAVTEAETKKGRLLLTRTADELVQPPRAYDGLNRQCIVSHDSTQESKQTAKYKMKLELLQG